MSALSPLLNQATGVTAEYASGSRVYDSAGRDYLDFTSGIGVTSTGHCHPTVVAAVTEQASKLIHGQYTTIKTRPLLELAERLSSVLPPGLDALFFANSGSESVEAALRLVRQATGRPNVVVFQGGFHGRTVGAASMTTSSTKFRAGFAPLMAGVIVAPFPTPYRHGWTQEQADEFALAELEHVLATQTHPDDTAAIFLEPILGEGGYVPATGCFLRGLRDIADRIGALLVFDEIQTGYGRTGDFWAHTAHDVRPDVLITAKGLASGFPLSAIAAPTDLMKRGWSGSQGGTYGGNAVACAAALATLEVITAEGLVENAKAQGEKLQRLLSSGLSSHPAVGDIRGRGLMIGIEFSVPGSRRPDSRVAAQVRQKAEDLGLLLLTCGVAGQVVRLLPPLTVTGSEIDDAAAKMVGAVGSL